MVFGVLYGPSLGVPFWHDDFIWIEQGRQPLTLYNLFGARHFNFVRPTSALWFHALAPLCGANPLAWRLAASLLLLTTAAALAALARDDGGTPSGAFASALFFVAAAHHWELVYGTASVGDPLVGLCTVVALLALQRGWWGLCLLAVTLAAGAKESACILPVLLLAHEAIGGGRKRAVHAVWPLALTFALLGLEIWSVRASGRPVLLPTPTVNVAGAWGRQIATSILTLGLHSDTAGYLLLAVWALLFGAVLRHRHRRISFAVCWIALAWLPYLLLASGQLDQDRYGYLASLGTALLFGALVDAGLRRRPIITAMVACAALLWNAHCHIHERNVLADWLQRRGDVAALVPAMAALCPPGAAVYVFTDPRLWHEGGYAFALYSGLPLDQVRDGFDFIEDRPGQHLALVWDIHHARYLYVGKLPPARGDESSAALNPTWEKQADGSMQYRPLDVSPWHFYRITVRYRSGGPGPRVRWSNDSTGPFLTDCESAPSSVSDGQVHQAIFFPWLSPAFWQAGSIQRLCIVGSAQLDILDAVIDPPPPRAQRSRIE